MVRDRHSIHSIDTIYDCLIVYYIMVNVSIYFSTQHYSMVIKVSCGGKRFKMDLNYKEGEMN